MKKKNFSQSAAVAERRIVGVEDLVLLTKLTNEGITGNLKQRFDKDEVCTCIQNINMQTYVFAQSNNDTLFACCDSNTWGERFS